MKAVKAMVKYVKEHPLLWIVGLVIPSLASLASGLMLAYFMEYVTAILTSVDAAFSQIVLIVLISLAALLVVTVAEDAARFALTVFIVYTEGGLKRDLFFSLVRAKYLELSRLNRGELLSRYNLDSQVSINLITYDLFSVIYPVIMGLGYLVAVFLSSVLVGLIMTALTITVILLSVFFMYRFEKLERKGLEFRDRYVMGAESIIRGRMIVRLLSIHSEITRQIESMSEDMMTNDRKKVRLGLWRAFTKDSLSMIGSTLMAPLACVLVSYGMLPIASIALIIQLCRSLIPITEGLGNALNNLKIHGVSYDRTRELLDVSHEPYEEGEENQLQQQNSDELLVLEQTRVRYDEQTVLPPVSFSIRSGEIIAITGPSGSGKSSIVRALLGLVDYTGSIKLMGKEASGIRLSELREMIAYVPELSDLFSGTVRENLAMGDPDADVSDLQSALNKAALDSDILNQETGARGENLSGGQRQRVAIARALLKKAPLIIMDEPTAAIDAASEQKVLETIISLKKMGKGVIIITHSESTLGVADHICSVGSDCIAC